MKRFISTSLGILAALAMSSQVIWAADPVQTQDREQVQTQTRTMQGESAGSAGKKMQQNQNRNQNRAEGAGSAKTGGRAAGSQGGAKSGKGR